MSHLTYFAYGRIGFVWSESLNVLRVKTDRFVWSESLNVLRVQADRVCME